MNFGRRSLNCQNLLVAKLFFWEEHLSLKHSVPLSKQKHPLVMLGNQIRRYRDVKSTELILLSTASPYDTISCMLKNTNDAVVRNLVYWLNETNAQIQRRVSDQRIITTGSISVHSIWYQSNHTVEWFERVERIAGEVLLSRLSSVRRMRSMLDSVSTPTMVIQRTWSKWSPSVY